MAWLEITLDTAAQEIETVSAALTAYGFSELVIEDQQELEGFLEENRACWDYIDEKLQKQLEGLSRIRLYLDDADAAGLSRLRRFAEERSLPMTVKSLEDANWDESWKSSYPPLEVGSRLAVIPCWLADEYESDRLKVILDPGLTFGTGAHPSTQMVMEAMERLLRPGDRCLDLGSGSGILSITALCLGAEHAFGVDIDPKAEDAARENAAYNGFGPDRFTALTGNVTNDRQLMDRLKQEHCRIVLVNIVADVIISLAPVLPQFLTAESSLILSGILDTRLEDVRSALIRAGLRITAAHSKEEWRCLEAAL